MQHHVNHDIPVSVHVLGLDPSDVPPFVRRCVRERSLSGLVKNLNNELLFGTADQREEARRDLKHIGFL